MTKLQQILHVLVGEHHFFVLKSERAFDELHVGNEIELNEVQGVAELCFVDGTCDDGVLDRHFCYFDIVCEKGKKRTKVLSYYIAVRGLL